jgi:hypothetical protein
MKVLSSPGSLSSLARDSVTVISKVRNEMTRLPHFFAHHRQLGVSRFVVIDNDSGDGTTDYLCNQPDTVVLHTADDFSHPTTGYGKWINDALQAYCIDHWALVLDADELFVFSGCESRSLPSFCSEVRRVGGMGVFAFMLDMYCDNYDRADQTATDDLIRAAPFFDSHYEFSRRPDSEGSSRFPDIVVRGGPRQRLFTEHQRGTAWRFAIFQINSVRRQILRRLAPSRARQLESLYMFSPPELGKVPLAYVTPDFRLSRGSHFSTPVPLYYQNATLLHFKLLPDYVQRLRTFADAGKHWKGGLEQRWLLDALMSRGPTGLVCPSSVRYTGSRQLEDLGLIRNLAGSTTLDLAGPAPCRDAEDAEASLRDDITLTEAE